MDHEKYKNSVFNNLKEEEIFIHQNNIRSKDHNVYTENNKKRALDNNDDKRYICEDLISTLAWVIIK